MENMINGYRQKHPEIKITKEIPLTLGYYNREDLPFYYQLADAFTIFDQYFCSSLTGTTPNRLFHWSGTLREQQNGKVKANVYNENIDYDKARQAKWKSFPKYWKNMIFPGKYIK
jgi:phospholipase C